jgi:HSP20 family molecular chaperone IbpA
MKVRVQKVTSLIDRVEAVQRQIAERAYELFNLRGCALGGAVDDWLAAERERVWKPPVELVEKDGEFLVEAAIAGVLPKDLDVQVTPQGVLIQGNGVHHHRPGETVYACEFRPGRLFRSIEFPRRVEIDKIRADYQNGLLLLWAPAATEEISTVDVR